MLGVNIVPNDNSILVALVDEVFDSLYSLGVTGHIYVVIVLVVRHLYAEHVPLAIRS